MNCNNSGDYDRERLVNFAKQFNDPQDFIEAVGWERWASDNESSDYELIEEELLDIFSEAHEV